MERETGEKENRKTGGETERGAAGESRENVASRGGAGRPYSYHTFLYPFLYDDNGSVSMDEFESCLGKGWEPAGPADSTRERPLEQKLWDYQTIQYFNGAARQALLGTDGEITRSYVLLPETLHNRAKYVIWDADGRNCAATINNIRLQLFNTGIAVMIYELENRQEGTKTFQKDPSGAACSPADGSGGRVPGSSAETEEKIQRIKYINEYGRRLYPEFLPPPPVPGGEEKPGYMLCAEKIELRLEGEDRSFVEDDFRKRAARGLRTNGTDGTGGTGGNGGDPEWGYCEDPHHLPNMITKLLACDKIEGGKLFASGKIFLSRGSRSKKQDDCFCIEPAIDDRMFVCCCIVDKDCAAYFLEDPAPRASAGAGTKAEAENGNKDSSWRFRGDKNIGGELYALINIDADDPSCQDPDMVSGYLDRQLYLRWAGYGSFHAVTNHSMFCLTGPDGFDSCALPFLLLYIPMCVLVLVQRASLISFDDKITAHVAQAQGFQNKMKKKHLDELVQLEEDFAIFQGQILLPEVTPQIQGIELYRRLQEMLFIDRLEENVQKQLHNLYETDGYVTDKRNERASRFFMFLAILSVFSALADGRSFFGEMSASFPLFADLVGFFEKMFSTTADNVLMGMTVAVIAAVIIIICSWEKLGSFFGRFRSNKKKKKRK